MSERIQNSGVSGVMPQRSKSQGMFLVLSGTAVIAFVAGFMLQFVRPVAGQAQEKTTAAAGKATVSGAKSEPTRYLARVTRGKNVVVVTEEEVSRECMLRHGAEVLDNIINRKVIETACAEANVSVSDTEVDQEILKTAKKFSMTTEQWYSMLQNDRNVTPAQYRRDIMWPMLALRKLAATDVNPTRQELQQAFERNYGPRVKARIIVLDNQRRAAEAWDLVSQHPEQFEAAVKKWSIDANSRALGGAVPPIPKFSGNPLSEPLEKAAFKLKIGEVSDVIQAGQQYIIIKCEGRTEQVVASLDDVHDQLIAELKEEKTQKAVAETFERIRDTARIDNMLTGESTGGQARRPAGAIPGTGAAAPGGQVRATSGQPAAGATRPAVNTRPAAQQPRNKLPE